MKVVLASLNAKYIHSSLASRCLKAFCSEEADISVHDYSINEEPLSIVADMYGLKPDIVGFSCYIWNIEETIKVAATLKNVLPNAKIVFGGPEVSFEPLGYLERHGFLDAVVCGEGEETFKEYLLACCSGNTYEGIPGLAYRIGQKAICAVKRQPISSLDMIPFPYCEEDFRELENKIVYYESSRGCAYQCSYCLSSLTTGVRYLSLERVEADLKKFISAGVKQVKFVDRTFNISKKHAVGVWKIILKHYRPGINFHFEIAADLLDEEMIIFLKDFPPGLLQFEIGVQSTNMQTLSAVNRKSDILKLSKNVKELRAFNNVHLHLDLIAGLPLENLISFEKSFNDVYALAPHHLQLGFLKLLHGTKAREEAEFYGMTAAGYPPYEVLKTNKLSFAEMLDLKQIEQVLENYFNSAHFEFFLKYISDKWTEGAFAFYKRLALYILEKGSFHTAYLNKAEYLARFAEEKWPEEGLMQKEILVLDILSNQKRLSFPPWLSFDEGRIKSITADAVRDERFREMYLPSYVNQDWRVILKNVLLIPCSSLAAEILFGETAKGCVLFYYNELNSITGRTKTQFIKKLEF